MCLDELKLDNILYGNHALTLIKDNNTNKFFLDDPTGLMVLNFNGFLNACEIVKNIEMEINPWVFIGSNDKITYDKIEVVINYLY